MPQGIPKEQQELMDRGLRRCTKCAVIKSLAEFNISGHAYKDGTPARDPRCKCCQHAADATYRKEHSSVATKDRQRLKEQGLKRCTACKKPKPFTSFYGKKYKQPKCKECSAVQSKHNWARWYQTPRGKMLLRQAHHRWRHTEKGKRKMAVNTQNHRARKKNNGGSGISYDEWSAILEQFGHRCVYCGVHETIRPMTMDHVVAIANGGRHEPANIVPACQKCNSSKGARPGWLSPLALSPSEN